ncbi:hypothetical protein V6N13_142740 [Hibiscus sabdariffa]|uniref:Uncharacterized protein n=1 Tax=Hibiscus sabdariffa TaxID=183260 RepID=A0ABR2FFA3_9ROSI
MKRLTPLPLTTAGKRSHIPNANARPSPTTPIPSGTLTNGGTDVFHSLEKQSEDRRLRILEAQRAYIDVDANANMKAKHNRSDHDDDDSSDMEGVKPDGKLAEEKKVKQKKPKVTVAEAAAKIDPAVLSAYLAISLEMINLMSFLLVS